MIMQIEEACNATEINLGAEKGRDVDGIDHNDPLHCGNRVLCAISSHCAGSASRACFDRVGASFPVCGCRKSRTIRRGLRKYLVHAALQITELAYQAKFTTTEGGGT